MGYKVLKTFRDKESMNIIAAGTEFEIEDAKRSDELIGLGYLEGEVSDESNLPEHLGGGYYQLSNGEKVRGKEEAIQAQIELDKSDDNA
jgi:hypothetical protein